MVSFRSARDANRWEIALEWGLGKSRPIHLIGPVAFGFLLVGLITTLAGLAYAVVLLLPEGQVRPSGLSVCLIGFAIWMGAISFSPRANEYRQPKHPPSRYLRTACHVVLGAALIVWMWDGYEIIFL